MRGDQLKARCFAISVVVAAFAASTSFAQNTPTASGSSFAPDEWLLESVGAPWWYRTAASSHPSPLKHREATAAEQKIVDRARVLFRDRPAKAIALIDGDSVVYSEFKAPANDESVFFGLSMGKTVTAIATGQALCMGKLTLETKALEWVPELKGKALGNATVRDLLRMASGAAEPNPDSTIWGPGQLAEWQVGNLKLLSVLTEDRVSRAGRGLFSDYRPGEHFSYKSTDPQLLGVVVGRATGMAFGQWLQVAVLDPMGASHTGLYGQDRDESPLADSGLRLRLNDWLRFAVFVKRASKAEGCFGDFVRAATSTQIGNPGSPSTRKVGKLFGGYGYFTWTDNAISPGTAWASGWGGQRISWHRDSDRMVVVFSNVEDWMPELYELDRAWGSVGK